MNASKKTIHFSAVASVIFLIFTYFITVNVETNFITVDSPWISNSFLLTFFGGAFASMVVVLLCEISEYMQAKQNAETYLFSHLYYLYGQLQVIAKNINWLQTQEPCFIHEDSLKELIANATAEMNAIFFAEYSPFCKQNKVLQEKKKYNSEVYFSVQRFLQDCRMLNIAILKDKLETKKCQMAGCQCKPENASNVLHRLSELTDAPTNSIDSMINRIDDACRGKYNWGKMKADFLQRIPDNRNDALECFLAQK